METDWIPIELSKPFRTLGDRLLRDNELEFVLVDADPLLGPIDHVLEIEDLEIGLAQASARPWILEFAGLEPALAGREGRPVRTQAEGVQGVADQVAIEPSELAARLGRHEVGVLIQVADVVVHGNARRLELDDDRRPFLTEQGDVRPLAFVVFRAARQQFLELFVDVALEDLLTVVPSNVRQRHVRGDVVVIVVLFAQEPDIVVRDLGAVPAHREEDVVDQLLVLTARAISDAVGLNRQFLRTGQLQNLDDAGPSHDQLR